MKFKEQFTYAKNSTMKRKKQSFLTALGVLIGIAAIVSMVALGQGFEKNIVDNLEGDLNTRVVTVMGSMRQFFQEDYNEGVALTQSDVIGLEEIENVELACALYETSVSIVVDEEEGLSFRVTLTGMNLTKYAEIFSDFECENGSLPNEEGNYIVIGNYLADPTDSDSFEIGDNITLQWSNSSDPEDILEQEFELSGILAEVGGSSSKMGGTSDNQVYISIETFEKLFGSSAPSSITLLLSSDDSDIMEQVEEDIYDYYSANVMIQSSGSIIDSLESTFETTQMFLAGIAAISLLVAGVGIMNIMTVSLIQRTREIGILKSLGISNKKILQIFVIEAALIGTFGSAAGLGVGWILAVIFGNSFGSSSTTSTGMTGMGGGGSDRMGGMGSLNIGSMFSSQITPYIDSTSLVLIFLFGIVVSVLFAFIPAWKAARLDPVEALREE